MTPLAEGIETEEQWRFLVDDGLHPGTGIPVQQAGPGRARSRPASSAAAASTSVHDADHPQPDAVNG